MQDQPITNDKEVQPQKRDIGLGFGALSDCDGVAGIGIGLGAHGVGLHGALGLGSHAVGLHGGFGLGTQAVGLHGGFGYAPSFGHATVHGGYGYAPAYGSNSMNFKGFKFEKLFNF